MQTYNIFTQKHETRDHKRIPIVSMDADHLVNTINVYFRKNLARAEAAARSHVYDGYAPAGMPEKQRIALGLRRPDPEQEERFNALVEDAKARVLEAAFQERMAYLVVGLIRDDTREGIVKLLQDVTGITTRIDLPNMTENLLEVLDPGDESYLLSSGDDDSLSF